MSAEDPKAYILNRDSADSARLSYQHQLLIARQGYYLHPSILEALSHSQTSKATSTDSSTTGINPNDTLRILDLATGNGIWALELAESLSKSVFPRAVEILGLDISSNQFPYSTTLPSNVSFDTWDLLSDVPAQYVGNFDIVHVRFITAILWQDDQRASKVLQQLHRLLKPGGFIQWTEPPPPVFERIVGFNDNGDWCFRVDEQPLKFIQTVDRFFPIQIRNQWLNQLDDFVKASGKFTDVQGYWLPPKDERARYEGELLISNCTATIPNILKIPGIPADAKQELEAEFQALCEGIAKGSTMVRMKSLTVIGRRL